MGTGEPAPLPSCFFTHHSFGIKEVHPLILRLAFFHTDRAVVNSIFRAFVRISSPRRISTAPRSCSSALRSRKSDVGGGNETDGGDDGFSRNFLFARAKKME